MTWWNHLRRMDNMILHNQMGFELMYNEMSFFSNENNIDEPNF